MARWCSPRKSCGIRISRGIRTITSKASTTRCKRAAAHLPRVDAIGGSSGGRVRQQRGPRRLAVPRREPGGFRESTSAGFSSPSRNVEQHPLRGGQRRRSHRAGRLDGPRRQPRARRRHGHLPGRRLRGCPRPHQTLAQRTGLRAGGLPRRDTDRRMVAATSVAARCISRSRRWPGSPRPPASISARCRSPSNWSRCRKP